MFISRL